MKVGDLVELVTGELGIITEARHNIVDPIDSMFPYCIRFFAFDDADWFGPGCLEVISESW
jgi:hypothetical protein